MAKNTKCPANRGGHPDEAADEEFGKTKHEGCCSHQEQASCGERKPTAQSPGRWGLKVSKECKPGCPVFLPERPIRRRRGTPRVRFPARWRVKTLIEGTPGGVGGAPAVRGVKPKRLVFRGIPSVGHSLSVVGVGPVRKNLWVRAGPGGFATGGGCEQRSLRTPTPRPCHTPNRQ